MEGYVVWVRKGCLREERWKGMWYGWGKVEGYLVWVGKDGRVCSLDGER